jgi:hypothetical protein
LCIRCNETDPARRWALFILSPTIVHCSQHYNFFEECYVYDDEFEPYEDVGIKPNVLNLLKYYRDNWWRYDGKFVFYRANKYLNRSLCIHKELYYTRPPLYEKINGSYPAGCKYDGKNYG